MDWPEDASPDAATASARSSPTRRRLLALLGGVPAVGMAAETTGEGLGSSTVLRCGSTIDPMPRQFAKFRRFLERHEAALACCDRIEATLLDQMEYPRVPLPPDWDGSQRSTGDADTVAEVMLPGRHQRRLQRILRRRQRRWDEAAHGAGLFAAQMEEAALDEAVLGIAEELLATPAWTLDAVVLKLLVLLSTQEPGPSACGLSPWRELRLILGDLRGLPAHAGTAR